MAPPHPVPAQVRPERCWDSRCARSAGLQAPPDDVRARADVMTVCRQQSRREGRGARFFDGPGPGRSRFGRRREATGRERAPGELVTRPSALILQPRLRTLSWALGVTSGPARQQPATLRLCAPQTPKPGPVPSAVAVAGPPLRGAHAPPLRPRVSTGGPPVPFFPGTGPLQP